LRDWGRRSCSDHPCSQYQVELIVHHGDKGLLQRSRRFWLWSCTTFIYDFWLFYACINVEAEFEAEYAGAAACVVFTSTTLFIVHAAIAQRAE
jgi:hypothetical protein